MGRRDLEVCIIFKNKPSGYKVALVKWDNKANKVLSKGVIVQRKELLNYLSNSKVYTINATICKNNSIYIHRYTKQSDLIKSVATRLRNIFEREFGTGTDLCGYCIQASEMLQAIYQFYGIQSKTVEGWCEYDDDSTCSDRPYDEHTWLEIPLKEYKRPMYIDITADQFNTCMYTENEFEGVMIGIGLPHGMCYDEPEGWEDPEDWGE